MSVDMQCKRCGRREHGFSYVECKKCKTFLCEYCMGAKSKSYGDRHPICSNCRSMDITLKVPGITKEQINIYNQITALETSIKEKQKAFCERCKHSIGDRLPRSLFHYYKDKERQIIDIVYNNGFIEYKLNRVNEDESLDSFVEIFHLLPEAIQNDNL